MAKRKNEKTLVPKDSHPQAKDVCQGWKAQSKLATLEKSLPQTKKACKGRMCDRKRAKERLFPPGSKDIIKRVFALEMK